MLLFEPDQRVYDLLLEVQERQYIGSFLHYWPEGWD